MIDPTAMAAAAGIADDRSMRVLEYVVALCAMVAALILGLAH